MVIKPIQTSTVQETVYEKLLEAMLSGELPPGEKITIEGLAKMLNVSLTPVRAALKKLEAGNFITIGKNRRITVTELSVENLMEILDLRLLLECYAAEKACLIRSDESIILLERLNKECAKAKSSDAYFKANRQFHCAIYAQAKLPILAGMIDTLWHQVSPYLHILFRNEFERVIEDHGPDHRGIIDAMKRKDPAAVRQWLTKDLINAAEMINSKLKKK